MWKFLTKLGRLLKTPKTIDGAKDSLSIFERIESDGTRVWRQVTNKNGGVETLTRMTHPNKPEYLSESVERRYGDTFYRRTETKNGADRDVFVSAYNYKMPNGQIVDGDFHRQFYHSYIDNKTVQRNGYGRSNFLAFTKDSDGTIHQRTLFHGPIAGENWFLRQVGGGNYDSVRQAIRNHNNNSYGMRFGVFL